MENNWKSFEIIEVSAIILFFAFQKEKSDLIDFINHLAKKSSEYIDIKDIKKLRYTIEEKFDSFFEKTKEINKLEINDDKSDYGKIIDYYLNELVQYKNEFKAVFKNYTCTIIRSSKLSKNINEEIDLYTYFMQTIGNNVRKYGDPYDQNECTLSPYIIVEKIDYLIKIINNYAKNDENKRLEYVLML